MTYAFKVSVDIEADAAYVKMTDKPVVTTREVGSDVMIDLDQFNMVVGIEMLSISAEIPFQRLVDEFHVPSDSVERLRALRPSIGARLSWGFEGTATPSEHLVLV